MQAYWRARAVGDPLTWRTPEACLLGARVLGRVGAPRAATLLRLRAYRAAPEDPWVAYHHVHHVHEQRGPYAALERLGRLATEGLEPELQADMRLLRAMLLTDLRDFSAAEYELVRAEQHEPRSAWLWTIRSAVLAEEDRLEEALEAAQEGLRLRPRHHLALASAADSLKKLGRIEEAVALLAEAAPWVEFGSIGLQLASLELARDRPVAARHWLEHAATRFPCPEPALLHLLAGLGSEIAYEAGDLAESIRLARAAGSPMLMQVADRLEAGVDPRRVRLAVPSVRQAHKTCGPATLASISLYFGEPAEHLAIADEICFDGTSIASERQWAMGRGFAVREFTVTWDSAVALLDRGLPFALCTQQVTSAHEQAVIGYDAGLRMFSVRDPSATALVKYDADRLLRAQAWNGPHGLVFAPAARVAELAALALPDAELHELAFTVAVALGAFDRPRAAAAVAELRARAPDHAVTASAVRSLAAYDGDFVAMLAMLDGVQQRHPDVDALLALQLRSLAALGQQVERRALLERLAGGSPIFDLLLAEDLLRDGRSHERAEALLRRCMRLMPESGAVYRALALLRLRQRRPDEARELLRFAVCLGGHDGDDAALYVAACQQAGMLADGLAFLRARFERSGRRFAEPAHALYYALEGHGRSDEAFGVLEQALEWRPDDGELLLFTARAFADFGKMSRARELLARASGRTPNGEWQGLAAHLDAQDGELAAARTRLEQVLADNPLALTAYRDLAPLDAALDGPSAALRRVEAAAARFPQHAGLARLRVEWTPGEDGDGKIAALRTLHAVAPEELDGTAQLALCLGRRGEFAEAHALVDQVIARAPTAGLGPRARAQLAWWQGEHDVADKALRAALHADIDVPVAIDMLVNVAHTDAARRDAIAYVREELRRQVSDGSGLAAYRLAAAHIDSPGEILSVLEEYRENRPELLAGWIEVIRQRAAMRHLEEAREHAAEAVRCFPLQANAHFILAEMLGEGPIDEARRAEQIAALEAAVALAPGAAPPRIALAEALRGAGQGPRAIDLLTHAIRRAHLNAELHAALAEHLWASEACHPAIERMVVALEVDPAAPERWRTLARMAEAASESEAVLASAERLALARPLSGWARFGVAILLDRERQRERRLAALEAAVALDPRNLEAHEERAWLLAAKGELEPALAACNPPGYGGRPPLRLRGRAAWIQGRLGDRARAYAEVQALVAEDPTYVFAWACIGDWARAAGDHHAAVKAYRVLLRHNPNMGSAAVALFDLEFELGERSAAARTIATMRAAGVADQADYAELRLALPRDGQTAALEMFTRTACNPEVAPWVLAAALELFDGRTEPEAVTRCLEQTLARPDAQPIVGRLWVQRRGLGPLHWLTMPRRLRALRRRGAIGVAATQAYIERLVDRFLGLALWWYVALEGKRLREDTGVWASTGAALRTRGRYAHSYRWFADWDQREGLEAWMLHHIAAVLRWAGGTAEARAASMRALALPGAEVEHPLWLALDAAMDDESPEQATQALAAISLPENCDAVDRWVFARCKAVLAARNKTLPPEQRRALVRGYVAESEACGATRGQAVLLRRLRGRVDRRIAVLSAEESL